MDVWKDGEAKWKEGLVAWEKDDAKAHTAFGKVVPNSIFMELDHEHFCDIWSAMEGRFENVTRHQKSNLKGRIHSMTCGEKENVIAHLEEMESINQTLSSRSCGKHFTE